MGCVDFTGSWGRRARRTAAGATVLGWVVFGRPGLAATNPTRDRVEQELRDREGVLQKTEATLARKISHEEQQLNATLVLSAKQSAHRLRRWVDAEERLPLARRRIALRRFVRRSSNDLKILKKELDVVRHARRELAANARGLEQALEQLSQPNALMAPVSPVVISRSFGRKRVTGVGEVDSVHRGLLLKVKSGQEVRCAAAGDVVFVGPLVNRTNAVIVDHGDFRTVTTGLAELGVKRGEHVDVGAPIGRTGDTPLGVQVRLEVGPESIAVDPSPWVSAW